MKRRQIFRVFIEFYKRGSRPISACVFNLLLCKFSLDIDLALNSLWAYRYYLANSIYCHQNIFVKQLYKIAKGSERVDMPAARANFLKLGRLRHGLRADTTKLGGGHEPWNWGEAYSTKWVEGELIGLRSGGFDPE